MYFSKVELSKTNPRLVEILEKIRQKNGYHLHQLIWTLFADSMQPNKQRDFLYRQESQSHWPLFYIVSHSLPVDKEGIWDIQSKDYQPQITQGQKLYFSLRANPRLVKTMTDNTKIYCDAVMDLKKQRGLRTTTYELIQEAGVQWLNKRSERQGFRLVHALVDGYQQHKLTKPKHSIQFSTIDYQGLLEVSDETLFLNTLQLGVGAAKGFGCGLLLIKRS